MKYTIDRNEWLSDDHIDNYIENLKKVYNNNKVFYLASIYFNILVNDSEWYCKVDEKILSTFFNNEFVTQYIERQFEIDSKHNLTEYEYIIISINIGGNHWTLVYIYINEIYA